MYHWKLPIMCEICFNECQIVYIFCRAQASPPGVCVIMSMLVEYGCRQDALVTHISAENLIYVQLDTNEAYALTELSESIKNLVKAHRQTFIPDLSERCFALSTADDVWYRAIVTSVSGCDVTVFYVDYGNTEILSVQSLCSISEALFESPYQAIQCVLSDFLVTSSAASVNAVLEDELLNNEISIAIQSKCSDHQHKVVGCIPCYNVAVYKGADSTCTISEGLVEKGLGQFRICSRNVHIGQKYRAYTSFDDSPGKFWIQFSDQYEALMDLMDNLNDVNSIAALQSFSLTSAAIGMACCCIFDEDNGYYRAEVIDYSTSEMKAKICFVDYGNFSVVKVCAIKFLPPRLCLQPSFAVQCCLDGIKPIKPIRPHPTLGNIAWSQEVCQKFKELIEDVEFEACIVDEISPEIYSVHLLDVAKGTGIGTLLCDLKCAESTASQASLSLVLPVATKPIIYKYLTLEINKTYKNLLISYAKSPAVVWCQPEIEAEVFESMVAELEEEAQYLTPLGEVRVGQACCVQYAEDLSWCRGSIQNVEHSSCTAEVLYIDFGNVATLKWMQVKALPAKYLSLPAQAARFSLAGISPSGGDNWSSDAIDYLLDLVMNQQLDCKTIGLDDSGYPAALLCDPLKNYKDVSLDLVDGGYAKLSLTSADGTSQQRSTLGNHEPSPLQSQQGSLQKSHRGSKSSLQKMASPYSKDTSVSGHHTSSGSCNTNCSSIGKYALIDLKPGQSMDALVSHVVFPTNFYLHPTMYSSCLEQLLQKVQVFSKSSRRVCVASLQDGLPVLAKFSGDGCWHRASIVSSDSKGSCSVMFVDYGNTEKVVASQVMATSSEFLELPAQAIRCTLAGVKTNRPFTKTFVNAFGEMTLEEAFRVSVVRCGVDSKDGKPVWTVDLSTPQGESVVQALSSNASFREFFESSRTSQEVKIPLQTFPVGKPVEVVMSYIQTPSKFFMHLTRSHAELEELSDKLNEFYPRGGEALADVKVGSFCVAQFSMDQLWYRGRVSRVQGSNATVCYVDFGNSENLKMSALKALKPDFSNIPCLGIPCKLLGISESENASEQVLDIFSNVIDRNFEAEFKSTLTSYDDVIPVKLTDVSRPGVRKDMLDDLYAAKKASVAVSLASVAPTLHSTVECIVSYISNPGEIYCQLLSESDDFQFLMEELNTFYGVKKEGMPLSSTTVGSLCAVLYAVDNMWYRGKIVSISPQGALVLYVDYGNTEDVELSVIRALEPIFCDIDAQAIRCSLANLQAVAASGWSKECVDGMQEVILEEETVEVTFLSTDDSCVYHVQMSNSGEDIATVLISKGWAREFASKEGAVPTSVPVLTIDPFPVEEGSKHNVVVSHVISPFEVYCQIINADENLEVLMEMIDQHCAQSARECDVCWEPGNFALGLFTEDGCWYRCVITDVSSDRCDFQVTYLDYGNSEKIGRACLLPLLPDFSSLSAQAVKCCLEGAQYFKYSAKSTEDFRALLLNREFDMKCVRVLEDGCCAVELFQVEDSANIVLVASEKGIIQDRTSATNSCISSKLSIQAFPDKIDVDSFHDVHVVFAESPSKFFCQFSFDNIESLQVMMTQLHEFYSPASCSECIDGLSCKIGDFVAAQFSADEQWYRAVVSSMEHGQVNVFFVDYGNGEVVDYSKLRRLTPQFMDLEAQAVCCSLADVVPASKAGWSDEAIDAFNELLLEHSCIAQIRSNGDMSGKLFKFGDHQHLPISLIDPEVSKSVADELICHGFALSSLAPGLAIALPHTSESQSTTWKFVHPKLHPGDTHKVYISFIESPSRFWLQFSSSEDSLMSIQDNLDTVFSDLPAKSPKSSVLQDLQPGSSCCAKFHNDGKWYRGIVNAVLSDGVEVCFVDYGNTEIVLPSDVMEIQPKLLAWDVQAFCCSLDMCHPVGDDWDESAIEVFSELVTDKILHALIVRGSEGKCWDVKLLENESDICEQMLQSGVTTAEISTLVTKEARPAPKMSRLELSVAQSCSVYIAYIDSPCKFFCQLASGYENLESLMAQIADFYNANALAPQVEVGSYCVAQYSCNCAWYRAQIISIVSDGILVNFIDYGNSEVVAAHQVLALGAQFAALPCQAVSCSLVEDVDTPFSGDVLNRFMEYDLNHEFSITVSSVAPNGQYVVQLIDQVGNLVNKDVLNSRLAASVSKFQLMTTPVDVTTFPAIVSYVPLQFSPRDRVEVFISHITSPTSFFCQPLELAGELDDLMTDIGAYMDSAKSVQSLQQDLFQPGTLCLAQFSEDKEWYRVIIEEVISGDKALVKFVDYGNKEVISSNHISVLPPQFAKLQLQVFHCSLLESVGADVVWSIDQVEQFRALVPESDQVFVMITKFLKGREQFWVSINKEGKPVDISFLLQHQFPVEDLNVVASLEARHLYPPETTDVSVLAVKGSTRESGSENGETESDNGSEGKPLIKGPFKLSLAVREVLEVSVVYIKDPSLIYIQREDCRNELLQLGEEIADYCAIFDDGKHFPQTFYEGDFVLAKWSRDDMWYRGEVLAVSSSSAEKTSQISFIDYGNIEAISSNALVMCPRNFLELPAQAISCSLTQVPNRDSWPVLYRDMIDKMVRGKVLQVTVVLPGSQGMRPTVKLEDLEIRKDISQFVLDKLQEECEVESNEVIADGGSNEIIAVEDVEHDRVLEVAENDAASSVAAAGEQLVSARLPVMLPERNMDGFCNGSTHRVFVIVSSNPPLFLCQFSNEADTLAEITQQLSEVYAGEDPGTSLQASLICTGLYVAAQYLEDMLWYRGRITSCIDPDMYDVDYIDFGNSDSVPLKCIRPLDESLAVHPPMAVQCALSGLAVPSCVSEFPSAAADMMLGLVDEAECVIEVVGVSVSGICNVILSSSIGVDVGRALLEAQLAIGSGEANPLTVVAEVEVEASPTVVVAEVKGETSPPAVIAEVMDEASPPAVVAEVKDEASPPAVVAEVMGEASPPAVVSEVMGESSPPAVVAAVESGPSLPAVVAEVESEPSLPAVVAEVMDEASPPAVVAEVMGETGQPKVVAGVMGGASPPEVLAEVKGEASPPAVVAEVMGEASPPAVVAEVMGEAGLPEVVAEVESDDCDILMQMKESTHLNLKEENIPEALIISPAASEEHGPLQTKQVESPAMSISADLSSLFFVKIDDSTTNKLNSGEISPSKDQQCLTDCAIQISAPGDQVSSLMEDLPPTLERHAEGKPPTIQGIPHSKSEIQPSTSEEEQKLATPDIPATSAIPTPTDKTLDSIRSPSPEFAENLSSLLPVGSCHSVKVTSVSSLDEFTCKLLDQQDRLQDLLNEIASLNYEVGSDELSLTHPKPALAVCCCSTNDNTWHRGEVIFSDSATGTYKVLYVDLGVTESLILGRLKRLKKSLADCLPPQSVKCSFPILLETDVSLALPSLLEPWQLDWPLSCVRHFEGLVGEIGLLQMEVLQWQEGSGYVVRLFSDRCDVRELLVHWLRDSDNCILHEVMGPDSGSDLGSLGAGGGGEPLADSKAKLDEHSGDRSRPQQALDQHHGGFTENASDDDLQSPKADSTFTDEVETDLVINVRVSYNTMHGSVNIDGFNEQCDYWCGF